jgi:hypothetical protein
LTVTSILAEVSQVDGFLRFPPPTKLTATI